MADGPASPPRGVISANNRLGLDYRTEARRLGPPVTPIIDAHAHIAGPAAAAIYDDARRAFGVTLTYSMTQLPQAGPVRDALGDTVRFIAFPTWNGADRSRTHRDDYPRVIESFRRDFDARILKLWAAPRLRDLVPDGRDDLWEIDSPWRRRACEVGRSLGMMFMVHVADPDIYFRTKYTDSAKYGTKRAQYAGLERMLDDFESPWIAAHMGGWPEDLDFLGGLLSRHPNLYLDCSATKWVVRELSRHPREHTRTFFIRWKGRILFGSDIVTTDDHTRPGKERPDHPKADQANSPIAAFDLYASRYWALRTLLETDYDGPSPIADPDLKLEDPARYDDDSAPNIRGLDLPKDVLVSLYHGTAATVIQAWERRS